MKRAHSQAWKAGSLALLVLLLPLCASAAVLWSDDFESGSLAQWTVTGSWTDNTTNPIFGTWSARPGPTDASVMRKSLTCRSRLVEKLM